MKAVSIVSVECLAGYTVRLGFDDGTEKTVDLEPFLHGPIFKPIRDDMTLFRSVRVEGHTIAWPNGADVCPDVLYYDHLRPAWMEDEAALVRAAD